MAIIMNNPSANALGGLLPTKGDYFQYYYADIGSRAPVTGNTDGQEYLSQNTITFFNIDGYNTCTMNEQWSHFFVTSDGLTFTEITINTTPTDISAYKYAFLPMWAGLRRVTFA